MLTRGLEENLSAAEMQAYMRAALDLVRDMKFFLTAAENKTETNNKNNKCKTYKIPKERDIAATHQTVMISLFLPSLIIAVTRIAKAHP